MELLATIIHYIICLKTDIRDVIRSSFFKCYFLEELIPCLWSLAQDVLKIHVSDLFSFLPLNYRSDVNWF